MQKVFSTKVLVSFEENFGCKSRVARITAMLQLQSGRFRWFRGRIQGHWDNGLVSNRISERTLWRSLSRNSIELVRVNCRRFLTNKTKGEWIKPQVFITIQYNHSRLTKFWIFKSLIDQSLLPCRYNSRWVIHWNTFEGWVMECEGIRLFVIVSFWINNFK